MRGVEQIPWLYDALAALAERGEIGRWRRWLTAGAQGRTLDVGTGTGRNLPLFRAGTFVVAVKQIADELNIPTGLPAKTLQRLAKLGLIACQNGDRESVVKGQGVSTGRGPVRS